VGSAGPAVVLHDIHPGLGEPRYVGGKVQLPDGDHGGVLPRLHGAQHGVLAFLGLTRQVDPGNILTGSPSE